MLKDPQDPTAAKARSWLQRVSGLRWAKGLGFIRLPERHYGNYWDSFQKYTFPELAAHKRCRVKLPEY